MSKCTGASSGYSTKDSGRDVMDVAWMRLLRTTGVADRAIGWGAGLAQTVIRAAICRCLPERLHQRATTAAYDRATGYTAGGHEFEKRLFWWEREFLDTLSPPGLLLVGAAGGGRELMGAADAGFDVTGFEPSDLVESAARTAQELHLHGIRRADYDALPAAAHGHGPLADLPFDRICGAILGWGSVSHVTTRAKRVELLVALRRLVPTVPVLYSFIWRGTDDRPFEDKVRLRYEPEIGFFSVLQPDDVTSEAELAAYRVERLRVEPYGIAWLLPS